MRPITRPLITSLVSASLILTTAVAARAADETSAVADEIAETVAAAIPELGSIVGDAEIVAGGSFSVSQAEGLVPGKYRVSVSQMKDVLKKGTGKKTQDSVTGEMIEDVDKTITQESIPARFNAKSELTADVTDAGPNDFRFDVTSK